MAQTKPRRRNAIFVLFAATALLTLILYLATRGAPAASGRVTRHAADQWAPVSTGSQPDGAGGSKPDAHGARLEITVDLRVETEDKKGLEVDVWAGRTIKTLKNVTRMMTGETKRVHVPIGELFWFAHVPNGSKGIHAHYETVSQHVSLKADGTVRLVLPRGRSSIRVRVLDDAEENRAERIQMVFSLPFQNAWRNQDTQ